MSRNVHSVEKNGLYCNCFYEYMTVFQGTPQKPLKPLKPFIFVSNHLNRRKILKHIKKTCLFIVTFKYPLFKDDLRLLILMFY